MQQSGIGKHTLAESRCWVWFPAQFHIRRIWFVCSGWNWSQHICIKRTQRKMECRQVCVCVCVWCLPVPHGSSCIMDFILIQLAEAQSLWFLSLFPIADLKIFFLPLSVKSRMWTVVTLVENCFFLWLESRLFNSVAFYLSQRGWDRMGVCAGARKIKLVAFKSLQKLTWSQCEERRLALWKIIRKLKMCCKVFLESLNWTVPGV